MNVKKHSQRTLRNKSCRKCGKSDGLYWAHNEDDQSGRYCPDCDSHGKFVLAEQVGGNAHLIRVHDCQGKYGNGSASVADPEPAPKPIGFRSAMASTATADPEPWAVSEPVRVTPDPEPAQPKPVAGDRLDMLNALLDMLAPKVDESQVRDILRGEMTALTAEYQSALDAKLAEFRVPRRIEVTLGSGEPKVISGAHPLLESVLRHRIPALRAGARPVMLVGPAGSGKTHLVKQVAEALDLPFFYQTLNPAMTVSQLLGYMTANGEVTRPPLRHAVEFGGVYLFNEVDNSNPSIATAMNEIIAAKPGEMIAFPDGMVRKHENFIPFADANTFGRGADRLYVGRQPLDGAFTNRWSMVYLDYDETVEQAICEASGADSRTVAEVLRFVRDLRRNIALARMPVVLSMRDSVSACAVIAAGLPASEALESEVRRGMSDGDWAKITGTVRPFSL